MNTTTTDDFFAPDYLAEKSVPSECPLCGGALSPDERLFHQRCADAEQAYADWQGEEMAKHEASRAYWHEMALKDGLYEP